MCKSGDRQRNVWEKMKKDGGEKHLGENGDMRHAKRETKKERSGRKGENIKEDTGKIKARSCCVA